MGGLRDMGIVARWLAGATLVAALLSFYLAGAFKHANAVNQFKARGDQSAYLSEAKLVYTNWRGLNDPPIVHPRNRMPLYPAFLAALYDPRWSDLEFFERARVHSIWLSVALLAAIAVVVFLHLPVLPATSFMLIVSFGYFVFKAGYVQSELLFYTLHFLGFVLLWRSYRAGTPGAGVLYAIAAGVVAALAHLTKAAELPFVGAAVLFYMTSGVIALVRSRRFELLALRVGIGLALAASFLIVLYPYIATSKRVHGQYFYNLNTSALIWYDNYPQASVAILSYGPDGWPPGRRSDRPGLRNYWRSHTAGQIAARFGGGFLDMIVRSYRTFWYLKFVLLYLGLGVLLIASEWTAFMSLIRRHRLLAAFLFAYAAIYLPAMAFYEPTSGTGTTRFLLAHVAPLLFVVLSFAARPPFSDRRWTVAGVTLTPAHVHLLAIATMGLDLTFSFWTRLTTTYGGF